MLGSIRTYVYASTRPILADSRRGGRRFPFALVGGLRLLPALVGGFRFPPAVGGVRRVAVLGLLFGALALTYAPAHPAHAQEVEERERRGRSGNRMWGGPGLIDLESLAQRLAEVVDLTERQREQVRELTERFRSDHSQALARLHDLHEDMREEREDGARPTREELRGRFEEHGQPLQELRPHFRKLREDVLDVLTAEQRRQLERMRESMRSRINSRYAT